MLTVLIQYNDFVNNIVILKCEGLYQKLNRAYCTEIIEGGC